MKEKKQFAKGLNFTKIFIFFLIGSLFGTYFEEILYFFQNGIWTNRQGLIYSPFSTLYGFGVAIYLIILGPNNINRGLIKTFIYATILGGTIEYVSGWILETLLNIKFWDYSNMILNINGKTTIPIMLIWGMIGTILLKILYPFLSKYIEKIPYKIGQPILIIVLILISFDILISYSAFIRMINRNRNESPKTFIGEFYDTVYNDEFMYKKFPILKEQNTLQK